MLHCFPEPLKKAIIVLSDKDGKEADEIKPYRPVTLLPTIDKLLEQILLRRLNHALKRKNILHHNQLGFRDGRSTDDAIHQSVEKTQDAKNKKLHKMASPWTSKEPLTICNIIQFAIDLMKSSTLSYNRSP
ncbi:hypothetical protein AVEN_196380-1 [Araneus ventricosus]|uniref:Reverse transcriptase domain-containing protein n=1 Tax=Araneus ventricosus TaxID=182803 RepID=A0A4Y2AVJ8_ARAVE|nr:hypothetical protein AVEN_196380-1 [Araneus ventricosus]